MSCTSSRVKKYAELHENMQRCRIKSQHDNKMSSALEMAKKHSTVLSMAERFTGSPAFETALSLAEKFEGVGAAFKHHESIMGKSTAQPQSNL